MKTYPRFTPLKPDMGALTLLVIIVLGVFSLSGCLPLEDDLSQNKDSHYKLISMSAAASVSAEESPPKAIFIPAENKEQIIAQIGEQPIRLSDIDNAIKLALFDLDWRRYEMRKASLDALIQQRLEAAPEEQRETLANQITGSLTPPQAPVIDLPNDDRTTYGNPQAPVTLSIFCSYQSSHCARLQQTLAEVQNTYQSAINVRRYDLPLGYHRYAKQAANAMRCADEFGVAEDFQNALYADINQLDRARYLIIAEQLNVELNAFTVCLETARHIPEVESDIRLAHKLGLNTVPIVLVNGTYLKGPKSSEVYGYYIDQALKKAAVTQPVRSKLPIQLVATSISSDEKSSTALLAFSNKDLMDIYRTGDNITTFLDSDDNTIITRIEADRVILRHGEQLEYISLQASQGYDTLKPPQENRAPSEASVEQISKNETEEKYKPLTATGKMKLAKQWINHQLDHQHDLEAHFQLADHVVEGVHLLKLKNIDRVGFYKTLGLKSGDVILRVNDQWVHEQQNPLWQSLKEEEQIKVLLMRKGFPVAYHYTVQGE